MFVCIFRGYPGPASLPVPQQPQPGSVLQPQVAPIQYPPLYGQSLPAQMYVPMQQGPVSMYPMQVSDSKSLLRVNPRVGLQVAPIQYPPLYGQSLPAQMYVPMQQGPVSMYPMQVSDSKSLLGVNPRVRLRHTAQSGPYTIPTSVWTVYHLNLRCMFLCTKGQCLCTPCRSVIVNPDYGSKICNQQTEMYFFLFMQKSIS